MVFSFQTLSGMRDLSNSPSSFSSRLAQHEIDPSAKGIVNISSKLERACCLDGDKPVQEGVQDPGPDKRQIRIA
jgi:hypothetical protein